MSETLTAREIKDISVSKLTPILSEMGFDTYKGSKFVRIKNDILNLIELFPSKSDFYVWYAVYPLCEYRIWLGSASIAFRYPAEERPIKVSTREDTNDAINRVIQHLPSISSYFEERASISNLEKSISDDDLLFPLLVKAYCLASLGETGKASILLKSFLDSGLRGGESREGADKLMVSIKNGSYREVLDRNKDENVKKLRLGKFIAK